VAVVLILILVGCYTNEAGDSVTTVLLVRHAERDNGGLSQAGLERAERLAHVAAKAGVSALYTTDTERTKATIQPLAEHLGLDPRIYGVSSSQEIKAFAASLTREHPGEVILVVGHNPSVPDTIDALGGDPRDCSIGTANDEFDDLCVVTIDGAGRVNVVNLQYGQASP